MYWTIEMTVTPAATKGLLATEESRRAASAPRTFQTGQRNRWIGPRTPLILSTGE